MSDVSGCFLVLRKLSSLTAPVLEYNELHYLKNQSLAKSRKTAFAQKESKVLALFNYIVLKGSKYLRLLFTVEVLLGFAK